MSRSEEGLVEGKAGMVTGAAEALGREAAILFGTEGASMVVNDLESQCEGAEETVAMVEKAGGTAAFFAGDLTDQQGRIEDMTEEDWDRTLDVNLKGVFLGLKHQLRQMRRQGSGGAIVNTASGAGLFGVAGLSTYVASKHGVVGLTKSAALEAGEFRARVNCVCPGAMRTPMLGTPGPDLVAALIGPQAIHRLTEPGEVAEAVVWLASDRAGAITGIAASTDLGMSAGRRAGLQVGAHS